jgi:hypothetical protein
VEETCTYTADVDQDRTKFKQEASITSVAGWAHIRSVIEEFCASRFSMNAHKGRQALENAVERLYEETKGQVLERFSRFEQPSNKENTVTTEL